MDLSKEKALKIVDKNSNIIIKEFIEGKFNFENLKRSQLSTLEGILEQRNFNLESSGIEEFINEKLAKNKNEEFYKDILANYIGKKEAILEKLECQNKETKVKNNIFREVYHLLKIYYKKENALKIIKD